MSNSIQVRELDNLQDQDFARNIFDITWSMDAGTEITPNLLQAMVHSGSYLSGAFIDNKIVGAAFAFPATNGGLHLHSHMTAVLPEFRDKGVGYALKIAPVAQRIEHLTTDQKVWGSNPYGRT